MQSNHKKAALSLPPSFVPARKEEDQGWIQHLLLGHGAEFSGIWQTTWQKWKMEKPSLLAFRSQNFLCLDSLVWLSNCWQSSVIMLSSELSDSAHVILSCFPRTTPLDRSFPCPAWISVNKDFFFLPSKMKRYLVAFMNTSRPFIWPFLKTAFPWFANYGVASKITDHVVRDSVDLPVVLGGHFLILNLPSTYLILSTHILPPNILAA